MENLSFLEKQLRKSGYTEEDTEALNKPLLPSHALFYYMMFVELSTCRLYENGPIPYTAILQVATLRGMSRETTMDLAFLIRMMDAEVLRHWAKEAKNSKGKIGAKKNLR